MSTLTLIEKGVYLMRSTGRYGFGESPGKGTPYFYVSADVVKVQDPETRLFDEIEVEDGNYQTRQVVVYITPNTADQVRKALSALGLLNFRGNQKPTDEDVKAVLDDLADGEINLEGVEFVASCENDVWKSKVIEKWSFYKRPPMERAGASYIRSITEQIDFSPKQEDEQK